jgi:hypothetical protein
MEIDFVSSLTSDDENRLAPALLSVLTSLLDCLPIAYSLRVKTTAGLAFEHGHAPEPALKQASDVFERPEPKS